MTSKILFKDVINDAVKGYAFYASEYPLILSIENHCSIEYQDKMAEYLVNILGDWLYAEPVDEDRKELPSPEYLRRKILIKAKKLPPGKLILRISNYQYTLPNILCRILSYNDSTTESHNAYLLHRL